MAVNPERAGTPEVHAIGWPQLSTGSASEGTSAPSKSRAAPPGFRSGPMSGSRKGADNPAQGGGSIGADSPGSISGKKEGGVSTTPGFQRANPGRQQNPKSEGFNDGHGGRGRGRGRGGLRGADPARGSSDVNGHVSNAGNSSRTGSDTGSILGSPPSQETLRGQSSKNGGASVNVPAGGEGGGTSREGGTNSNNGNPESVEKDRSMKGGPDAGHHSVWVEKGSHEGARREQAHHGQRGRDRRRDRGRGRSGGGRNDGTVDLDKRTPRGQPSVLHAGEITSQETGAVGSTAEDVRPTGWGETGPAGPLNAALGAATPADRGKEREGPNSDGQATGWVDESDASQSAPGSFSTAGNSALGTPSGSVGDSGSTVSGQSQARGRRGSQQRQQKQLERGEPGGGTGVQQEGTKQATGWNEGGGYSGGQSKPNSSGTATGWNGKGVDTAAQSKPNPLEWDERGERGKQQTGSRVREKVAAQATGWSEGGGGSVGQSKPNSAGNATGWNERGGYRARQEPGKQARGGGEGGSQRGGGGNNRGQNQGGGSSTGWVEDAAAREPTEGKGGNSQNARKQPLGLQDVRKQLPPQDIRQTDPTGWTETAQSQPGNAGLHKEPQGRGVLGVKPPHGVLGRSSGGSSSAGGGSSSGGKRSEVGEKRQGFGGRAEQASNSPAGLPASPGGQSTANVRPPNSQPPGSSGKGGLPAAQVQAAASSENTGVPPTQTQALGSSEQEHPPRAWQSKAPVKAKQGVIPARWAGRGAQGPPRVGPFVPYLPQDEVEGGTAVGLLNEELSKLLQLGAKAFWKHGEGVGLAVGWHLNRLFWFRGTRTAVAGSRGSGCALGDSAFATCSSS
jgi:hypothetical protein